MEMLATFFQVVAINETFDDDTEKVNSKSYAGDKSCIHVSSISDPGDLMTTIMGIKCTK